MAEKVASKDLLNGVLITKVTRMLGHTKSSSPYIYAKLLEKTIGEDMFNLEQKMRSN